MSNFAWWSYLLSFTHSYHFQWPWLYSKITVVSNSFDRKFGCYPIKLKLCTIVDYIKCIMNIPLFKKKKIVHIFLTLHDYNLAWGLHRHSLMTLTLFQDLMPVRNLNCKLRVLNSCPLLFKRCMVVTYIKKLCTIWFVWRWCVFKGDN